MPATAMNHFTILTDQLDETVKFYGELLELEPGKRPNFKFPGAWLYKEGQAILHVIAGDKMPEPREGVIDHMAFSATGLVDMVERLKSRSIEYDLRRLEDANVWQLFFFDPNGAKVELDFDLSEPAPA
ncbi:MAG: VOC family protein [Betaproteobacteria bacterium]|nr:MAG: VOC family protein [Betaproteobacteria bacterium]